MPSRDRASYRLKELLRGVAYATPLQRWLRLGGRNYSSSFWDEKLSGEWGFHLGGSISGEARNAITLALVRILLPDARSMLDVGCASGSLLRSSDGRYAYTGVDISPFAIEQAKGLSPSGTFEVGTAETFTPKAQYDVIVLSEVLYYLTLDAALNVAERYTSHLTPHGILIVSMLREAKTIAIFRGISKRRRWLNGFIYQEKNEGPKFSARSERTRAYLTGAFARAR